MRAIGELARRRLRSVVSEVHVIADTASTGNALAAIRHGFDVGCLV